MSEWVKILIAICVAIQVVGVFSALWFAVGDNYRKPFCFFIKCSLAAFQSDGISLLGKILSSIVDLLLLPASTIVFIVGLVVVGIVRLFTTKEGFKDLFS